MQELPLPVTCENLCFCRFAPKDMSFRWQEYAPFQLQLCSGLWIAIHRVFELVGLVAIEVVAKLRDSLRSGGLNSR